VSTRPASALALAGRVDTARPSAARRHDQPARISA